MTAQNDSTCLIAPWEEYAASYSKWSSRAESEIMDASESGLLPNFLERFEELNFRYYGRISKHSFYEHVIREKPFI